MKKFIIFILWILFVWVWLGWFSAWLRNWWINIDSDWFLQMFGSGIVWKDVIGEQYVWTVSSQQPVLVAMNWWTISTQCFDDGWTTEIFGRFEKPHDATVTGAISPHLHWLWDVTSANTTWVVFFTYSIIEPGKLPTAEITLTWYMAWGIVAWSGRVDEINWDIYDSWISLWWAMLYRTRRNADFAWDTYPGNICIEQVWLHYQTDRLGSRFERVR